MSKIKLPQFSNIHLESYVEDLDKLLKNNLEKINALIDVTPHTWGNLMQPIEDMEDEFERFWAPFSHQHAVVNSDALRACYQACLPTLSAYESAVGQNKALYDSINSLDKSTLNTVQQKIVEDSLQNFELSGVALDDEKKKRFEAIQTRLAELSNQFENNVLDAEGAFGIQIDDQSKLAGLPEYALHRAKEAAKEKGMSGFLLTLEFPSYYAVVTYAEDRQLREKFYEAYVTRASNEGPQAAQFDNSEIIHEILSLRLEKAVLLGFANYAELSLATKMANSTTEVIEFLEDLSRKAYPQAQADINNLAAFARDEAGIETIKPWDIGFLTEKLRQKKYALSQEELRPYFPESQVMKGLFAIIEKLYGITFEKVNGFDTWHPDVRCYQLKDEEGINRGYLYMDLFARPNKRGGAWMDSCQTRRRLANGEVQLPIAFLTCNFAKPIAEQEATFSHDEILTLFHETGHCLHHLLTKVDFVSASGIHGVEWDAVELPSQIFENWCWEQGALQLLTQHVTTKTPLPAELYEKLLAAKNFQSAMIMMRQIEFSLFDFRLHREFSKEDPNFIASLLHEIRTATTVVPIATYNRFQNSFSHIFAGGYAAGYYSYKWAELLSSDAYGRFEEEGIFNEKTGRDFLHKILEVGGSMKAADAFQAFRGRPAEIQALLRHNGIKSAVETS